MDGRLKNWLASYCKKAGVDLQTVDANALCDNTLSYAENKEILKDHVDAMISTVDVKLEETLDAEEKHECEMLKRREEDMLERIKKSSTPEIDRFYEKLAHYVRMVAKGFSSSLFLVGGTSVGKTFNTLRILTQEGQEFDYVVGKITALDLYHTLYANRAADRLIVFDDTISLIKNDDCMALLLSALWSSSGNRVCVWRSTSSKLKAPKKFNFDGRIIFTLNETPDNEEMRTLLSRCLTYELNMTYKEKLMLMYEISKLPHPKLNSAERRMVVEFLEEHTNEATKNFNLRLQHKVEQMMLYKPDGWKSLALTQLEADPALSVVQELIERGGSVKEQKIEFIRKTGLSPRSYHNYKQRLTNGGV